MPVYPLRCTVCQHHEEVVAKMSERDDLKCSKCGGAVETDYGRLNLKDGNKRFIGRKSVSMMEGWHPDEVQEARELVGSDLAGCIRDDGKVEYADEQTRLKYVRRIEALEEASNRDRAEAAHEHKERVARGDVPETSDEPDSEPDITPVDLTD